jgi:fatty-acyl-CoA synthase
MKSPIPTQTERTPIEVVAAISNATDPKAQLARLRSFTIWRALNNAAALDPEHCALVGANDAGDVKRMTYAELLTRIRDLSAGLASIGVRRGDRVVLWMTNTFEWVICAFAIMRIGASVVPVNTFLKAPEIKYFIQQSGARHLLMIDGFRSLKMPELLAEICPGVAQGKTPGIVFSETLPDLRNIVLYKRSGGRLDCAFDFDALARDATPEAYAVSDQMEHATRSSDLAMVKYTSGSTAFPKGVMLEQGGIVANAVLHSRRMGVDRSDVYFSMMPFFHAGGSIYGLMTMLVHGGTLVFTEAFNAALAADLMVAERATVFVTMLGDEVVQAALAKGHVFTSVRVAALPNAAARKVMPNVSSSFQAFGLTETHGPAALSSYLPGEAASVCNGRLLEGNEGRVVDPETGIDVPTGTPGELLLRGNIARGYWNKPVETARAFTEDGWFRTEDLVSINAEGYLTWHGRVKLMLKIGGENVSIEEVERVVTSHETVADCGAVGVPDKRKGEAIRLYVRPLPGQTLTEEDLRAWLKPRVAHFKLPREIVFVENLPRLGSGKIDRVQLAQWAKSEVQS